MGLSVNSEHDSRYNNLHASVSLKEKFKKLIIRASRVYLNPGMFSALQKITYFRINGEYSSVFSGEASFREEVMLTKTSNAKREAI